MNTRRKYLLPTKYKEVWRQCADYPIYEVSNVGRVRNSYTGRVMTPIFSRGYYRVRLRNSDGRSRPRIHRLVAVAFIENKNNLPIVDHINRIRHDNRVENLRWVNNAGNYLNNRKPQDIVEHVISLYKAGLSIDDIKNAL